MQANIAVQGPLIDLTLELIAWGSTCHTDFSTKRVAAGVERGERDVAYEMYQFKFDETHETTVFIRETLEALIADTENGDEINDQYGFIGPTPTNRADLKKLVDQIKETSDRLRTALDPRVLAATIIDKLVTCADEMDNLWLIARTEKQEALTAYDALDECYNEGSQKLRLIYRYAVMEWGKYSPNLLLLGFNPLTPPPGHGQPDIPLNFIFQWDEPTQKLTLQCDPCTGATSYQFVYSEDGEDFDELYAGEEPLYTYQPPAGTRTYKVRARNSNGFSEFSDPVEFTPPVVPE